VFPDPQNLTYATVAKVLPTIGRGAELSEYRLNDAGTVYNLSLSHQFKARNRAVARLRRDAFAADPLVPSQNLLASATATFTIDFPTTGLFGAPALANSLTSSSAQYQYKVTICHKTHSAKNPWVQISVSNKSLPAHFAHGDFIVTTTTPCPPAAGPAAPTHGNKHK
jgi:hypothetical protein